MAWRLDVGNVTTAIARRDTIKAGYNEGCQSNSNCINMWTISVIKVVLHGQCRHSHIHVLSHGHGCMWGLVRYVAKLIGSGALIDVTFNTHQLGMNKLSSLGKIIPEHLEVVPQRCQLLTYWGRQKNENHFVRDMLKCIFLDPMCKNIGTLWTENSWSYLITCVDSQFSSWI